MRARLRPLLLLFWLGLVYTVVSLPEHAVSLSETVAAKMEESGISNPVTAVLLNFRGYDTLLELAVLLAALLGVWSLRIASVSRQWNPGQVLDTMSRQLVPVLIVSAGYLLWAGTNAPGGAFQAGSLLGAAGVLLLLCGWRIDNRFIGLPLRLLLASGLGLFVLTGVALAAADGAFLQYPPSVASQLVVVIEAMATLSIGATLAALFMGGRPGEE
ncbi:Na(+)/H(+) antiporter subunit B [Ferrimonas kyonanensis]|uniref:Na(+)/H(+) antiporter subunit B n=1 Tax=Ferrimonas kyonanensis TaxID=364763 RepID=UPI00042139B1|nr:Na(+)/H(+) antiporter subunit B [Ferrimonas kyonanensis]